MLWPTVSLTTLQMDSQAYFEAHNFGDSIKLWMPFQESERGCTPTIPCPTSSVGGLRPAQRHGRDPHIVSRCCSCSTPQDRASAQVGAPQPSLSCCPAWALWPESTALLTKPQQIWVATTMAGMSPEEALKRSLACHSPTKCLPGLPTTLGHLSSHPSRSCRLPPPVPCHRSTMAPGPGSESRPGCWQQPSSLACSHSGPAQKLPAIQPSPTLGAQSAAWRPGPPAFPPPEDPTLGN